MKITQCFASLKKVINVQKVIQNLLAIELKNLINAIQDIDCKCV